MTENKTVNVLDKGFVKLIDCMGNDTSIAKSARVSYSKGTKTVQDDENLIRYLWRNKHTSPFEMVTFTFHIKLPIFVSNQWVRHRTWSFNQISGRYSEMPDEFYVPDESKVTKQNPANKQGGTDEYVEFSQMPDEAVRHFTEIEYKNSVAPLFSWEKEFMSSQKVLREQYEAYINSGMRRELARINLPLSQYTEMYATVDLHNLLHFLRLRLDHHAQYEIRVYAEAILTLIKDVVPIAVRAFEDYTVDSMSLSGVEIQALQELLQNISVDKFSESVLHKIREKFFVNKREGNEFLIKMNRIFTK